MVINPNNFYPGTFTEDQVITEGATVTLTPGVYTKVGEYIVKADELVGPGRGGYNAQDTAIGRLFAQFYDNSSTPVAITKATFRIMTETSQDMPVGTRPVYLDVDCSQLVLGATDPTHRFTFPFENLLLQKDKKFVFLIKNNTTSAVTLSRANSKVAMDITRCLV